MRDHFFLKRFLRKENGNTTFSWSWAHFLRVCTFALLFIHIKGACSAGDMLGADAKNKSNSIGGGSIRMGVGTSLVPIKRSSELDYEVTTEVHGSSVLQHEKPEDQFSRTDTSVGGDPIENALLPEPYYYESLHIITSSMHPLESPDDVDRENRISPSLPTELESAYYDDEEETLLKSSNNQGFYNGMNALTPLPVVAKNSKRSKTKHKLTSLSTSVETKVVSTPRSNRNKYPLLKKVSAKNKEVTTSASIHPTSKTKRSKKVTRSTTEKTKKLTKGARPITPLPNKIVRNPHHPHGVVVFDKRKKRPKPSRTKNKPTTTTSTTSSTTSTTTPTTTTAVASSPFPEESEDYFYYWSSGESSESAEVTNHTSTLKNNSTSSKKRVSSKIPLSKLAMAMIASSTVFDNGTASGDAVYYPKSPVNLLNILQSYTKQLQLANGESIEKQPVVQIQSSPFMVQLSQLPFGTRIAISIYYSLIAIIPLVYLAFGGLGRLGFLNAFAGRGLGGRRRRRKRRSNGGDHFHFAGNRRYQTTVLQRADLNDRNEDEYLWILGRISEIIMEFSLLSNDTQK